LFNPYFSQLTAKKRVGEYRADLPGREHGRAYVRTRDRARLANGYAGRRHSFAISFASFCFVFPVDTWVVSAPELMVSLFFAAIIAMLVIVIS
jgi:hypothetical protein